MHVENATEYGGRQSAARYHLAGNAKASSSPFQKTRCLAGPNLNASVETNLADLGRWEQQPPSVISEEVGVARWCIPLE